MKFRVTFKTPDVLDSALSDAWSEAHCEDHEYRDAGCSACIDASEESRHQVKELAEKFIEYGEYVTIEFDTETQTSTVVPK